MAKISHLKSETLHKVGGAAVLYGFCAGTGINPKTYSRVAGIGVFFGGDRQTIGQNRGAGSQ